MVPYFKKGIIMKKIRLALVGRPNVGKSALFNRICGRRIAIVDEAVGVTRDRLYASADFFGKPFEVIDTGGIDTISKIPFYEEVRMQTQVAIEEADVLVMVVDARVGPTALDELVAANLLKTKKRVVLAVNKIDDFSHHNLVHGFYKLGIQEMVAISATQGFQMAELLEMCFAETHWPEEEEEGEKRIQVAIIGRANVGKSTLVNHLLQEQRCVVSPIAGTTRDSIDTYLEKDGVKFTLIDTAGIRRKGAEHEVVDKFAAVRTERALERADVCVLVMDATQGMTAQEKKIAEQIEEAGKGCILLFNKWDLVKGFRMEHCLQAIRQEASFLSYCPAIFASAATGRNLEDLFSQIAMVEKNRNERVSTGQLNKFVERLFQQYHPPMIQGKRLRVYYTTQVQVAPPRFVLFVNAPELMLGTYKKYMVHQFRSQYAFTGVPLVFELRGKGERQDSVTERPQPVEARVEEPVVEEELEEMPDLQEELDPSYG
jgi:GTP-binding protein